MRGLDKEMEREGAEVRDKEESERMGYLSKPSFKSRPTMVASKE